MTAKQLLEKMPDLLDDTAVADVDAVIQYLISEPVYQVLKGGTLEVHDGTAAEPDLVVTIGDDDLVKLFRGELNALNAFMTGMVRVQGDMMLAQKLVGLVDHEKLQALP